MHLKHWVFGLPSSQQLARVDGTDLWHLTLAAAARTRASSTSSRSSAAATASGSRIRSTRTARAIRSAPTRSRTAPATRSRVDPRRPDAPPGPPRRDLDRLARRSAGAASGSTCRRASGAAGSYPLLVVHDGHDYLRYASLGDDPRQPDPSARDRRRDRRAHQLAGSAARVRRRRAPRAVPHRGAGAVRRAAVPARRRSRRAAA